MIDPDDKRLVYMPEDQVLSTNGFCVTIRERWFAVHPERGLVFWQPESRRKDKLTGAVPQCVYKREIIENVISRLYPWAEPKQFPLVLAPIRPQDYIV